MKLILTGSLGNISKPLAQELIQKGHSVTVISSNADRKKDIEALGATPAIGKVEDVPFLTSAFKGADAVYCMIPPPSNIFDANFDVMAEVDRVAHSYAQAIQASGVKRVVHLSSIGAHTDKGNGMLRFHFNAENILKAIPDVAITHMRPVGFYYNMLNFIGPIKGAGVIAVNYGGEDVVPWVSPIDIAAAVAAEIVTPLTGRKVLYVASEEISCQAVASLLGAAIGKPDLKWIVVPDEAVEKRMIGFGMNANFAKGFVEMNAAMHSGLLFEDYYRNRPVLGKVKVKDFAKDFAAAFNQPETHQH